MNEEQENQQREEQEAGKAGGYAVTVPRVAGLALGRTIPAGMLAGVIGGAGQALFMMLMAVVMGGTLWGPIKGISTMILGTAPLQPPAFQAGPVLVGAILHLAIMALLGGLFGVIVGAIGAGLSVILGAAYGLVVWLLSQFVFWPLVQPDTAAMINTGVAVVALLIYGLLLGLLYPGFRHS